MRILGRFLHTLGQRYVIARAKDVPPLGAVVKTKKMRIGKIQEVFGPVKKPYVQIKLEDHIEIGKDLRNNDKLYYLPPRREKQTAKTKALVRDIRKGEKRV